MASPERELVEGRLLGVELQEDVGDALRAAEELEPRVLLDPGDLLERRPRHVELARLEGRHPGPLLLHDGDLPLVRVRRALVLDVGAEVPVARVPREEERAPGLPFLQGVGARSRPAAARTRRRPSRPPPSRRSRGTRSRAR